MLAIFTVLIATFARLLPHLPNFAPIAATALFGSVYLNKKYALILPIVAMVISDIFIGFDSLHSRSGVYGSFLLIGLVGLWLRTHKNLKNIIFASFASSLLFFLITNAEVWAFSGMYTKDLPGLLRSYLMGIPFFRNTLLSDIFYTGVFFGSYELSTIYLKKYNLKTILS